MGFIRTKACGQLFFHPAKDILSMVHGDDFVGVGPNRHLEKLKQSLEEKYRIKTEVLGRGAGQKPEIRILNKVVRDTPEGIELEADPRHSEIVVRELGLQNAKASLVPGTKEEAKRTTADIAPKRELDAALEICAGRASAS